MTARELATEHLGAGYYSDPYSVHARLRARCPVTPVVLPDGMPAWLITGYAEARAALADPRLPKNMPGWQREAGSVSGTLGRHMLDSDPPDHERLRRLVNKAFTVRRVERLRPRITAIGAALLDDLAARRETDLLASFAFPLPITVICELLGVPVADQDDFRTWTATAVADTSPAEVAQAHATAMISYVIALIAAKRQDPADDLLSALVAARDDADRLTEPELVSMIFLLLVAGHETTVNLIGSGVLALLLNPAELARLSADPSLVGGAVEEMLRYVNPVSNATFRCAAEPVEIGGVRIGRGDAVFVSLSGANRDPARFGAPDQLDLGRDTAGHLAFGHGIHYCVGAPLARLEAEIAFTGLLARFPRLELAVPPESLRWRPSTLIHGLESLPVRLNPPERLDLAGAAPAAGEAGGIPVRWDA
jgi:cytochrome P450